MVLEVVGSWNENKGQCAYQFKHTLGSSLCIFESALKHAIYNNISTTSSHEYDFAIHVGPWGLRHCGTQGF